MFPTPRELDCGRSIEEEEYKVEDDSPFRKASKKPGFKEWRKKRLMSPEKLLRKLPN